MSDETLADRVRDLEFLLYEHREDALTCYDHGGYCCACGAHDVMGYRLHLATILAGFAAAQRAEAWDEGHRTRQRRGPDACTCAAWSAGECACGLYGTGPLISLANNPYRTKADQ